MKLYENNLNERLFNFAVDTIKFLKQISNEPEIKVIKYQLTKSSSSSGANYEEAQGASSKSDFHNKIRISLKEMRESNYWLRILYEINVDNKNKCRILKDESDFRVHCK